MATVLRVRRKRINDPAESLVFSCSKKARTADGESAPGTGGGSAAASKTSTTGGESGDDVKKVFKFAGTVGKKDEPIAQQIEEAIKKGTQHPAITSSKPTKSSTKSSKSSKSSKSKSKSREKARSIQQKSSQTRRFQVLSSFRGIDLNELDTASQNPAPKKAAPVKRTPSKLKLWNRMRKSSQTSETPAEDEAKKLFCLYDVTQEDGVATTNGQSQAKCKSPDKKSPPANPDVILCNSVQMVREKLVIDDKTKETDYVYDLYYIEEGPVDLNGALSMGEAEQELIMEYFVSQEEELEETYEDDSDSNDEGNWRNDYPEDEPDKRHPDLFDELIDDYCYGEGQSSDEDFGQYSDIKKKTGKRVLNYNAYGGSDDDLGCYS
ncbi:probable RNA polymerase II nuclear localization protein SLC7A6OS [Patiria miniata]|uniref:Probable RNA polymerase II nuclear localization protein SLC7A6OS n=1 Tax=Patiria miniata TaxID=46514 RepID=A0A914AV53_PATMI|nr:probable RNA polymerase II nuclear localization protein SLC7A6OS [Patiria miniata]